MFVTKNLYQNDAKWKSVALGNQDDETIGSWGCLLTSMTMVLNAAGYDETPETVNARMKAGGGFMDALVIPSALPVLFPKLAYRGFEDYSAYPAPVERLDAALESGKPVIVQVDWDPKAGIQTHWVLLKERKGEDYALYDPYMYKGDSPTKEVLLTQRYKHQGSNLAAAISGVMWFDILDGAVQPPERPKLPVPAEKFTVYVAVDDLALRADPAVTGYLYKRLMLDTPLISLEAKSVAQAKIGQAGQWLQIQEPDGEQGYVAAWYVGAARSSESATPPSITTTPPAAGQLTALPTQAELALRSKMLVAPETLIKRLPLTEKLTVIEDAALALEKIGKQDQWIKVRDTSGTEGYVAAWYVRVSEEAAGPASVGELKVRTTLEAVSLRSQPWVADATLIKRLPLGAELTLIEAGAEAKIGRQNQWIRVKDAQGTEGYVAAWYVAK